MAIKEQWGELLEPGLRKVFYETFDALSQPSRIATLFNVVGSTKSSEHYLGAGGFSDWQEHKGTLEYDDMEQLFKTTMTHVPFSRAFKVERELIDDEQYNIINDRPRGLALAAVRTREKHAASVFNNAFSSAYLGGDAVALCSASHPYSPSNPTVQGNAGSTALSYDSVVATRKLMRRFVDDRGETINSVPRLILVPADLEDTAHTIIKTYREGSTQMPGSADYEATVLGQWGLDYLVWDYLDDSNDWFMIDMNLAKLFLKWHNRVPVEFAMDPTGDFHLEHRYRGYMRFSYGWADWRWIYGHEVA